MEGSTWDREVTTVNGFYRWAVGQGLVPETPIEQRPARGGRDRWLVERETPAERPHGARRHAISWLPPASYRRWRDTGVRGYRPGGLADPSFRGRHAARNQAFCDLMLRTGLRLQEQVSLTRFELSDLDSSRVHLPFWLPVAVAKGGSARWIYVPASVLRAVWDYVAFERAEAVERARANGTYEELDDPLLVDDPSRPRVWVDDHWVEVAKLDPTERGRLLVRTSQGLEPTMLWLREDGLPTSTKAWQGVFKDANRRCQRLGVKLRANPHKLRRTLAWFIARHPGGVIAGAIAYRHQRVQMFEGHAGTSRSGFRAEVEAEQALERGERLLAMVEGHEHQRLAGPAAPEAETRLAELGRRVGFAGTVVTDPRRLKLIMRRHDPGVFLGEFVTCVFNPDKALCLRAGTPSSQGPALADCKPMACRNVALTGDNLGAWQQHLAHLDMALSDDTLASYLRHRLQQQRDDGARFLETTGGGA